MSYLTENIKVLLWKNKGELSNKTYCEYINHVAQQCHMDPDYFRAILRDTVQPTGREVNLLRKYFEDYGYDLSAIQYRFLFEELLAKSGDDLLAKNIQYLLKSLTRGKMQNSLKLSVLIRQPFRAGNRELQNPTEIRKTESVSILDIRMREFCGVLSCFWD